MKTNIEIVSISEQIDEIPIENADFCQIQNLSFKTIQITDDAYLLGRAFCLVKTDNKRIIPLIDKGLIRLIDTPVAQKSTDKKKPKSRKMVKQEQIEQQNEVLESLNELFVEPTENVRQTP